MTTHDSNESPENAPNVTDAERLAGLLRDLETLQAYLQERGRHSYELAQRFLANARRDAGSRAYDERQATMLEYQHYIWHEIAGRVTQLLVAYGGESDQTVDDTSGDSSAPAHSSTSEQEL